MVSTKKGPAGLKAGLHRFALSKVEPVEDGEPGDQQEIWAVNPGRMDFRFFDPSAMNDKPPRKLKRKPTEVLPRRGKVPRESNPRSDPSALPSLATLGLNRPIVKTTNPVRRKLPTPKTSRISFRNKAVLRASKPIVASIPIDVWQVIFAFCPPRFLIKARSVCRVFKRALEYNKTWEDARWTTYGPKCPGPPAGLTEMQFADLISGIGCQDGSCSNEKCRKIYWAFQRRWCEKCLVKKVTTLPPQSTFIEAYPMLDACLINFTYDKWEKYHYTGRYKVLPDWVSMVGFKCGYERRAIMEFITEVRGLEDVSETAKNDWYLMKKDRRDQTMTQLQAVETFFEELKRNESNRRVEARETRGRFFELKAMELDPPLDAAALCLLASYQRASAIDRPATEYCWEVLKPKVESERARAETIQSNKAKGDMRIAAVLTFRRLPMVTSYERTWERVFITFAVSALERLVISMESSGGIADQDLVPYALKHIRQEFYSRREELDMSIQPNELMIHDAMLLYEYVLRPIIADWDSVARRRAAISLKCPGCVRRDVNGHFTFIALMHHILDTHAEIAGDFSCWNRYGQLIEGQYQRYLSIVWPSNLPILAEHHPVTGRWDPNDDSPYVHAPEPKPASTTMPSTDIFRDRDVAWQIGPPPTCFPKNVIYAASMLKKSSLAPKFKTQIVYEWALQNWLEAHSDQCDGQALANSLPDFEVLTTLQIELMAEGHHDLFEGFRCKWCMEQHDMVSRPSRFVGRGQPLADMVEHFGSDLHPRDEWLTRMFYFPTHQELGAAVLAADENTRCAFDKLFPPVRSMNPSLWDLNPSEATEVTEHFPWSDSQSFTQAPLDETLPVQASTAIAILHTDNLA